MNQIYVLQTIKSDYRHAMGVTNDPSAWADFPEIDRFEIQSEIAL